MFRPKHHSKLFRSFKSLDDQAYQELIRFFEENEAEIQDLDFEEYFAMLCAYANALFEVGAYREHLLMVDSVIETSIQNNLIEYEGEDIFRRSLFKKAASLYHTQQYAQAEHVLRELLKMDAQDPDARQFLHKCLRTHYPQVRSNARALAVFLVFLCVLLIAIEVLFVRPFYGMYTGMLEGSRNSIFVLACLSIVFGETYHRWLARREAKQVLREL
jgi:tetratricopeptide (TPR) repeat protein